MWFFNSKKYINPYLGCLGVSHSSFFSLSPLTPSPIHHFSFLLILSWERKMNFWSGAIFLLAIVNVIVF
jgi:hypothetical protein